MMIRMGDTRVRTPITRSCHPVTRFPQKGFAYGSALRWGILLYRSASLCYGVSGSLFRYRSGPLFLGRSQESVKEVVRRRVEDQGVWWTDGAAVYASAAEEHQAEHKVTLSTDPKAEVVFHWINIVISNAKTFIDGTYHGRGQSLPTGSTDDTWERGS